MKRIEKVVEVPPEPATSHVAVSFACEICAFTTDDSDESKAHYGKAHAAKATRSAAGRILLYFETKADGDAWARENNTEDGWNLHWRGPGWYIRSDSSGPCGRGCCTKYYLDLTLAEDVSARLRAQAADCIETANEIEAAAQKAL